MHPIQSHIISKLMFSPCLRYAKLKPKEIEGNLFMYHLRKLIDDGLIAKKEDGYHLTAEGKMYVDKLSLVTLKPRLQPKIISLLFCENDQGELLLYHRRRAPFIDLVWYPYGKIHLGETILEAATRELKEKSNLAANLVHKGEVYVTIYMGQDLVSQMLCHIFATKKPLKKSDKDQLMEGAFWTKLDQMNNQKLMPGFMDIYKLVKKSDKGLFFEEFVYNI